MRASSLVLVLFISTNALATPIEYRFEGYTTSIILNNGEHDPGIPLVRDDDVVITNGDSFMSGSIVFDPDATRSGAGGSGLGDVLSWTFSTQGLTYVGEGGGFHFLTFDDSSFKYHDELPSGGYGPDVAYMDFNFQGEPFAQGPEFLPIDDFIGGSFFTSAELAWVRDDVTMWGLGGRITELQVEEWSVPGPSSFVIMLIGLFSMWLKPLVRLENRVWFY